MKKFRFIIVLLLLLGFILPQTLTAQEKLTGKVLSKSTKEALPGVSVFWEGTSRGTATGIDGSFSLAWPDSFPSTLIVRFVGFKSQGLLFTGKAPANVRIELSAGDTLSVVTIVERRNASEFSFINPIMAENITQRGLRKAACCNLSESFETNPTVDAAVTDAVSGARKIQLLGLDGVYSQILFENLPLIRGLSASYGLSYVPGTWIKGILITKGTGSVVNGYESIAGQLNIDLLKPGKDEDRWYGNVYANHRGRYEANFHINRPVGQYWGTTLLGHASTLRQRNDMNRDGFLDMPMYDQYNVLNRWSWLGKKAEGQFGARFVHDDRRGGQFMFDRARDYGTMNYYGIGILNRQAEFFNKAGFMFESPARSIGTLFTARYHKQEMFFGLKSYNAEQKSLYANVIWEDMIRNTSHVYKTGVSFVYDKYDESFNDSLFGREEIVPGMFLEYTGHLSTKFTVVAGIRGDLHNIAGFQVTPRLHMKYDITPKTALRLSGGRGFRTANVFTENSAVFASSRTVIIRGPLKTEMAWNYGGSVQQLFTFMKNDATFIVDFFRTDFTSQVVMDMEEPGLLKFYNLNGPSYANSFQADLVLEPLKRFDVRLAYKFYEVRVTYDSGIRQRPLSSQHRAFINLAYALPYDKWTFDFTAKWIGETRLPYLGTQFHHRDTHSDPYFTLAAHVAKKFRKFDIYLGAENILNFMPHNPILFANEPFGPYFDASQVYAATDGRIIYAGLRFSL